MNNQLKTVVIPALVVLALIAGGILYFSWRGSSNSREVAATSTGTPDPADAVKVRVAEFGKKLQNVSLSASADSIKQQIQENYSPFVSPELLAQWQQHPTEAPGRLTSSPWPDRIEITGLAKNADGSYGVEGVVVEITSKELTEGGNAAVYPVTMQVSNQNGMWIITAFEKKPYMGGS